MLFMISLPPILSSRYFSLKASGVIASRSLTAAASAGATLIMNDRQQLPQSVQLTLAATSSLRACTCASMLLLSNVYRKSRKCSCSPAFSAAAAAISWRLVCNGKKALVCLCLLRQYLLRQKGTLMIKECVSYINLLVTIADLFYAAKLDKPY